jgi:hypothetical protein
VVFIDHLVVAIQDLFRPAPRLSGRRVRSGSCSEVELFRDSSAI